MGFFDRVKRLFRRKKSIESIQSLVKSIQSDSIDSIAEQEPEEIPEIPEKEAVLVTDRGLEETQRTLTPEPEQAVVEKDSFQLGLAAGYTGKSIKEIEHSLGRIESQMATKDWFKTEFEGQTPKLVENLEDIKNLLKEHDLSMQNRFEVIQSALERAQTVAVRAPEPIKTDILKEIEAIKSQIPLSAKMKELVLVTKSVSELSYKDLATRLAITTPALRGLLSNTIKRTDKIERFRRSGRGWVRYKGFKSDSIDLNRLIKKDEKGLNSL